MQNDLRVHQPTRIKTDEVRELFHAISPDLTVVVAYGRILPAWLLEIPRLGCVNVHFSLLPKYRGAAPVNWAIVRGEKVTGVTTMLMDPGMDTGPLLLQQPCEIGPEETAPELARRMSTIGADLLIQTIDRLDRSDITPQAQDDSQATLAPMLKREDGLIDWNLSAEAIVHRIRGFQPWPGAWTLLDGHRLIIWRAKVASDSGLNEIDPGLVGQIERDYFLISCGGQTFLKVEELQLEGKRRLTARDFLNGTRLTTGVHLGQ